MGGVGAQPHIENPPLGWDIWSEICRGPGAIFWLAGPATIIRSAWRGVFDARSMPNLARSWRGPPVDMRSIPPQARPKMAGPTELFRAYPATLSALVGRIPLGRLSSPPHFLVPGHPPPPPHKS